MKLFNSPEMRETLHRLLRSQMASKGVDYRRLSNQLHELGIEQSEANLRSKINAGSLGAQLFIYIQFALGIKNLDLEDVKDILEDVTRDSPAVRERRETLEKLVNGSPTAR